MPARQRRAKSKTPDEAHQEPEGRMVGRGGLEPPTSRLSGVRSNQLSYRPQKSGNPDRRSRIGGGYRVRTGDPLLAKQVLSQLS